MWFIEDKNLVGFDIFFLKFVFLCIYMYFKVKDVYIYILRERERLLKRLVKNGNFDKL